MKRLIAFSLAFGLASSGASIVHAQSRSEQGEARKEMRAGNILRSKEIEARILPSMGNAEYLGFAYDPTALAYRLKFIEEGRVTFVDVDARTGRVLRRSR